MRSVAIGLVGLAFSTQAHASIIANNDTYTPNSLNFTVAAPGVLANDVSSTGTRTVQSIDVTGLQGSVTAFADGRFIFNPTPGLSTNTSFTYRAIDGAGGFDEATVTFDMVSTLPTGANDSYTPNAATFNVNAANGVLANDSSPIGPLTVQSINVTGMTGGSVSAFANGSFSYQVQGAATNQTFTYTARDIFGRTIEQTVFLDLESTLPIAVPDVYTPNAATFIVNAANGVLVNDSGGIGALSVQFVDVTTLQGSLTAFADGRFIFNPTPGLSTNTSFSYSMRDSAGRSRTATVVFDMETTLPVAVQDIFDIPADVVFNLPATGVLTNDTGGIGALKVSYVDITGLQGALTAFADGSFIFVPTLGFVGTTSFLYALVDSAGRSSLGTVLLRVGLGGTSSGGGTQVPEPESLLLLASGLMLLAGRRKFYPVARRTSAK